MNTRVSVQREAAIDGPRSMARRGSRGPETVSSGGAGLEEMGERLQSHVGARRVASSQAALDAKPVQGQFTSASIASPEVVQRARDTALIGTELSLTNAELYDASKAGGDAIDTSAGQPPVQRYLIVGNHDYTDDVNIQGFAVAGVAAGVLAQVRAAMAPPAFAVGTLENTMYQFLLADAGWLVTRQLIKWIEDQQGQDLGVVRAGGKGNPAFGRKQQARVYDNYVDLGRALYGWVRAKPGRHQEKQLADAVYDSTLIDAHINNVLAKIKAFIDGKGSAATIVAALSANNPLPAAAPWAQYRNWFNHGYPGLGLLLPHNYYDVLANPDTYSLREKIASLHDIMIYLQQNENLDAHLPAETATTLAGRSAYVRPASSMIRRNSVARAPVADVAAARGSGLVRSGVEEQHATYTYARTHDIPMWGRHSGTAARMVALTRASGGSDEEMMAVADATMAFWRKDYDHRSIAYHTLHEIQDRMPDFGLPYAPLTRYADMQDRLDLMRTLMARLNTVANSPNWANKGFRAVKTNTTPDSILRIRAELATANSDEVKLRDIRAEVQDKTGFSLGRKASTATFYRILARIPANVDVFMAAGTPAATNRAIALQLQVVRRELQAFHP